MSKAEVFLDSVPLGSQKGPFPTGKNVDIPIGIPTTFNVTIGEPFTVSVEGIFTAGNGELLSETIQSINITASP
jgi:hypothetical protein